MKQKYDSEINELEESIEQLKQEENEAHHLEEKNLIWMKQFEDNYNIKELTRDLLTSLVEIIYINADKSVNIQFKYQDEFKKASNLLSRQNKYTEQVSKMININRKEKRVWNTALYIRLSQDDKDKSVSNSIINQKKLLNDYVSQINDEDFSVIDNYIDDGYTGTDFNRPAFKRMMHDMSSPARVNCIVVKDLSRFGREHIDVDNYLERIFPLLGIRFISVMQNLDSFKNPEKMNSIEIPFLEPYQ